MAPSFIAMQEGTLLTEKFIATMMQQYLHKGHHLFIDNYYTSISLTQYFTENGTYVTRTIRYNRKNFPAQLSYVVLNRGGAAYYNHSDISMAKYRRNKDSYRG